MASPSPTYLIVGATGTQGSSVISALLAHPSLSPSAQILALTRNTSSPKSKSLAALDTRVRAINGDPSHPSDIFTARQITSVFLVTVHGPPGSEEKQAHGMIDAALANGVKHFVFTSADRGGEGFSDTNPTPVAHIATKYRIELYLKEACSGTGMSWTILRPTTFMENLTPTFEGKVFATWWEGVGSKPVQLVAAADIGHFAAAALLSPAMYSGRSIGIAGDELNFKDAETIFKETMGVELPTTFCAVGGMLKVAMKDMGAMFKWFEKDGYAVDIKKAREEYPGLQNFRTWLINSSGFERKGLKE